MTQLRPPSLAGSVLANDRKGARAAGPITGPESPQSDRSPDHRFTSSAGGLAPIPAARR